MAFATVGCLGELNTDIPSTESGDEVQFGLSLPSMTRTTYGDKNAAGTAYPIYWVDGDKVQVYSPQCLAGRNDAEYKVSVNSATQNYATSLTPTGANGVQWGDQPAMFYSVYPSGKYTISDEGATIQNLKINFSDDFEVSQDEQGKNVVTPKGADCLMFAKTPAEVDPGTPVNLSYSPMATSVIITLQGPSANSVAHQITIQSIKLIAPSDTFIAGNFNVEFDEESNKYVHTGWVDGSVKSNSITVQVYDKSTDAFHVIERGETLQIPIFLAPIAGLAIKEGADETKIDDDWRIEVLVQTQITENEVPKDLTKTFTKKLKFAEGFNANLEPGMVHELPALPTLDIITDDTSSEWQVGDWMTNVPRNVYLSEVSIPGSWNSLNPDFQTQSTNATATVLAQYNLGIRAFHIETRWQAQGIWALVRPNGVLGVAVGGETLGGSTDKYMPADNKNAFKTVLDAIVSNVQDDEYLVVVCSFAQNSAEYNGANGWIKEISNICASNDKVMMASVINQDTLVGDALGKVIVIINTENDITSDVTPSTSLAENSKCLFTYLPSELTADHFNVNKSNIDSLWRTTTKVISSGLAMYNTQAQVTSDQADAKTGFNTYNNKRGYAPSIIERKEVLEDILAWSKQNYAEEKYVHDRWIYFGLGGYQVSEDDTDVKAISGSYSNIASVFNTWIDEKVSEMGTKEGEESAKPYYPVGIVYMNNVSEYQAVVKNILLLNNKYRLQYDPDKPADYKPATTSAAASYSSGMHDQNVAAFGWD